MFIINIADPIILILMLAITVILIFLAKETKKAYLIAIALLAYLGLLTMHILQSLGLSEEFENVKSVLTSCVAVDFIMILLSFLSYLWVDDIEVKIGKKKSVNNGLEWFWG